MDSCRCTTNTLDDDDDDGDDDVGEFTATKSV